MPVAAAPAPTPPADTTPRLAVTQDEADAIAQHFDMGEVDHIQVSWVGGYKGRQALLWPIKSKWLGYVMVFLLVVVRGVRPVSDPPMPWDPPRRPRPVAQLVLDRA